MVMLKLTIEQKEMLVGQKYDECSYFNPVQDINGDWFISPEEVNANIYSEFFWIRDLELVEYIKKIDEDGGTY